MSADKKNKTKTATTDGEIGQLPVAVSQLRKSFYPKQRGLIRNQAFPTRTLKERCRFTQFSSTAAASLPWGPIKAGVGGVGGMVVEVGGHPVGVNTPSGVGARRETRRDLSSTR